VSKINLFLVHEPTGIRGHVEITDDTDVDGLRRLLHNVGLLLEGGTKDDKQFPPLLLEYHFKSEAVAAPVGQPAPGDKSPPRRGAGRKGGTTSSQGCPDCGGPMWDNTENKRNPRAPDHKCKDPQCGGCIWPERDDELPYE